MRVVVRLVLCLTLWNGPIPLLHAHERDGAAVERDIDLADHVRVCHHNDSNEECRHWHLHLMLWGEFLQSDDAGHSGGIPASPSRHLDTFIVSYGAGCPASIQHSSQCLDEVCLDRLNVAPIDYKVEPQQVTLLTEQIVPYLQDVARTADASRFLMVSRC